LENIPEKFRSHLAIMGKKAADALPKHQSYDSKMELKEGETARGDQSTPCRKKN